MHRSLYSICEGKFYARMHVKITRHWKSTLTQVRAETDQVRFLGNCPPTPPLTQHYALTEK